MSKGKFKLQVTAQFRWEGRGVHRSRRLAGEMLLCRNFGVSLALARIDGKDQRYRILGWIAGELVEG